MSHKTSDMSMYSNLSVTVVKQKDIDLSSCCYTPFA